ncbi:hypothetical protein [Thermococcus waiotapuensis]|uniref:Uncharacterized protein n=1 Tax=Thermococcus waiotapuensis TaxID=90909 RepID=A0AAE4NW92_9EURY|nr:hypothetical protein [Thermococcus waiotapuensis]MDV3103862.1 hypothetical protein [Thermococcus waiotapuensis]
MSCGELGELVKRLALAFVILFVSGFLVLYYAIRMVACAHGLCDSGFTYRNLPIYSADMLVVVFVLSLLLSSPILPRAGRGSLLSSPSKLDR